ncbi:MAG: 30S ribosomal protein S2 [bacterium]
MNISMKTMLEAGVHFGHQTRRWNPKMARYIFGERNGIHILDLQKTVKEIKKAYAFMKENAQQGKRIIFVGTKKQAKDIVREEAARADVPCVYEKWLGGTLTNFATIRKSVKRLEELEKWESDGVFNVVSKKEVSRLTKEMNRLKKLLTGIRSLSQLPEVMFVIDPVEEIGAVSEAKKLGIPLVAVCDTNCNPDLVDWPVPGNDDAARSIRLFCSVMADAVIEGRQSADADRAQANQPADADSEVQALESPADVPPPGEQPKEEITDKEIPAPVHPEA